MRRLPTEFEDLLTAEGRKVLAGRHAACGALADPRQRFLALEGLIRCDRAEAIAALLERALAPDLERMAQPIPPDSIDAMTQSYTELLPKTVRVSTAYLERARQKGAAAAAAIGLPAMLRSGSYRAFATALAGKPLKAGHGIQALRYGPGDYAGPHNDHHPDMPAARRGYFDLHLSFSTPGVRDQWLVHAKAGHLTEMVPVATRGGITAYRLPFWHYTTPLRGEEGAARWVLLGTFLYRRPEDGGRAA